jgi:hypothetical protein
VRPIRNHAFAKGCFGVAGRPLQKKGEWASREVRKGRHGKTANQCLQAFAGFASVA